MGSVLIGYSSKTGHVKKMALSVAGGVEAEGLEARVLPVGEIKKEDLLAADGIIIGSYTSFGVADGAVKTMVDRSISVYEKLQGKVGGAFASSGSLGGGNEMTVLSILQMLLVHGMIIPGDSEAPHFGAVAIGEPTEENLKDCERLGKRVATLVKKLQA